MAHFINLDGMSYSSTVIEMCINDSPDTSWFRRTHMQAQAKQARHHSCFLREKNNPFHNRFVGLSWSEDPWLSGVYI